MRGDTPARAKQDGATDRLLTGALGPGVLGFGAPLALAMGLYAAFNLVDLLMISRLPSGTAALAALAICDMVNALVAILSNGVSTASVAVISRRFGEGDGRGTAAAIVQSLWLVTALSVVFGVAGVAASDLIVRDVMQAKGEAAALAVPYLEILVGGSASIFLLLQVTAVLRAVGQPGWSAGLLVAGNLLNVVLDVLLIYGPGPHPAALAWAAPLAEAVGAPRLEVVGAAIATLIGRTLPALFGLWLIARHVRGQGAPRVPSLAELRRLIDVAWPASVQQVLHVSAVLAFIALLNAAFTTAGDPTAATAYSICLRIEMFVLLVSVGWGSAASTYVGANLGARNPQRAKRAGWVAAAYGVATALVLVVLYLGLSGPIVGFFDPSPRVLSIAERYLWIVAASHVVLAAGTVLSQAMTGAGDTRPSMVIDGVAFWALAVPLAAAVTLWQGLGLSALFACIAAGNLSAGVGFIAWYARGLFLERRV